MTGLTSAIAPEWRVGSLVLTSEPFLVPFDDVDYGSGENVTELLRSLLQDGDVEVSSRTGNRTVVLPVLIEATNMAALAAAETALALECDKPRNEVYCNPGDGHGLPFIFDVFRGQLTFARDDTKEKHGYRAYTLTFRAHPFSRSISEVVAAALAASGSTTTSVNDGSATTNWAGAVNGVPTAPAVVSGAVKVTNGAATTGEVTCALTLTAAIPTSSTKYLVVDWKPESNAGSPDLTATADGVLLAKAGQAASPTAGFTRTWFGPVAASSIAVLRLDSLTSIPSAWVGSSPAAVRSLYVDQISRTDVKPSIGTARQLLRSIPVAGSARTQGALAVEHASSALGDVLVYVFPDSDDVSGYSPPCRQYLTSAAGTPAAALVSGAYNDISAVTNTYDVPVSRLPPGSYYLLVRWAIASGTATPGPTVTWTTQARIGSNALESAYSKSQEFTAPNPGYHIAVIDRLTLPSRDFPATSPATMRLTFAATTQVDVDEVWLFNASIGQLVQVGCGASAPSAGGSANRLWIEPATVPTPRPTIRIGFAADRSDAFHPSTIGSWQLPVFAPPRVNAFTVTTNALDADVTLRHFPRWHTHAAS